MPPSRTLPAETSRRGRLSPPLHRTARIGLALAGLAWLATLGQILRGEVLQRRESEDVRALVDSARLTREHASASYVIRLGTSTVGSLTSTVSGGQHEEQLAYVVEGRLSMPEDIRLKGVVLAGWDRRPERVVLEAVTGTTRHRLEGVLRHDAGTDGTLFEVRLSTGGGVPQEMNWVLPEAPVLAPGPLPIPEFSADATAVPAAPNEAPAEGARPSPFGGASLRYVVTGAHLETLIVAGRPRRVRRRDIQLGAYQATAWVEASGFPVRLELPGSIVVELVSEKR